MYVRDACVFVCARARLYVRVSVCLRACLRMCVPVCVCVRLSKRVRACVDVCVRARCSYIVVGVWGGHQCGNEVVWKVCDVEQHCMA